MASDAAKYMAAVRAAVKCQREGRGSQCKAMRRRATAHRRRLVRNPRIPQGEAVKAVAEKGSPQFKALLAKVKASPTGRRGLGLFRRFWGLSGPERIVQLKGRTKRRGWLIGMGVSQQVHLSSQDKGEKGRTRIVRGHWMVATEADGKRIVMLSGRPASGAWKPVGYAPETRYIPTEDIERAGTHKKGRHWRHIHGQRDAKWLKHLPDSKLRWPRVYADRGGVVNETSNFMYGPTPSAIVKDWMYG